MSADPNNKIDNTNSLFPFAAVVNQEKAKEALLLAVINPAVHGVLFLGEKGTGKTTLVRSLSTLLPETQVIDLPLGCGEEMVLGTVDAEKALATGKISVKPGILTRADGPVLYTDEVNLLADHLWILS
jgi:Mg-chelatase subunit ChlI